jgi:vacuolar protein sorting-associated protein 13A/C
MRLSFVGDVVFENLELKESALDEFNLPFTIRRGKYFNLIFQFIINLPGFIGKMKLLIPWKNLKNEPVIVLFENIFILAIPQYRYAEVQKAIETLTDQLQYNAEAVMKTENETKQKKLSDLEKFKIKKTEEHSNIDILSATIIIT